MILKALEKSKNINLIIFPEVSKVTLYLKFLFSELSGVAFLLDYNFSAHYILFVFVFCLQKLGCSGVNNHSL